VDLVQIECNQNNKNQSEHFFEKRISVETRNDMKTRVRARHDCDMARRRKYKSSPAK